MDFVYNVLSYWLKVTTDPGKHEIVEMNPILI